MSKVEKAPAYQWYPKDIISSQRVSMMTLAEEGAYRRALDFCWLGGSLPANSKELARVIGKNCPIRVAEAVKKMFEVQGDKLIHERLEQERKKQKEYRESQQKNGNKGGRPKKQQHLEISQTQPENNPSVNIGLSETQPEITSASSSLSAFPSSLNTIHTHTGVEVFDLKYFEGIGYSWNIEEPLYTALNDFLVYRQQVHKSKITDGTVIESILKMFIHHGKTAEENALMIQNTMSKQAKNIIYELPKDKKYTGQQTNKKQDLKAEEWV